MILSSVWIPFSPRRREKAVFSLPASHDSNHDTAQQLRAQINDLQAEAEQTRAKANNARLRFMRLSEAAEKLRQQAALTVQAGKENEARELLLQKRKVMQALEKSKSRIELLDQLSIKLNQAISAKETQLVGNISVDLELTREDVPPVRIISPKEEAKEDEKETRLDGLGGIQSSDIEGLESQEVHQPASDCQQRKMDLPVSIGFWDEDEESKSLKGIPSYEDFLKRLDLQLSEIETEFVTGVRLAISRTESDERIKVSNLQQILKIREEVLRVRARIAKIILAKARRRLTLFLAAALWIAEGKTKETDTKGSDK